jgi:hypothetical protein
MKTGRAVLPVLLGAGLLLTLGLLPSEGEEYSHARIVRLSFVEGAVTVQRSDMTDWAEASVNTPIQEGFKLSTAENGFAEVEFENTSTVRLGQLSLLEFTQLALLPAGGKINRLALRQGYATFHAMPDKDDIYEVAAADATLRPYGKTIFRVDIDEGATRIEVFAGSLDVSSPFVSTALTKNKVLELQPNAQPPFEVTVGIAKDAWDEWVEQRESSTTTLASRQGSAPYSPAGGPFYGGYDLYDYGNWTYLPGYGYGWIPTVGMGWSPYSLGRWCWYPGFGYTWISYEPWGWLPYHYGSWNFIPGYGWSWFPGSFSTWSPALVSWYQGPGWIGWAPLARNGAGVKPVTCPAGQACGTAVNVNTFVNGRPVNPRERMAVDFSQARVVSRPDLAPTRAAMLPGMAVPGPNGAAGPPKTIQAERPAASSRVHGAVNAGVAAPSAVRPVWTGQPTAAPTNRGAGAMDSAIVFDPQQGRYVNNPRSVLPITGSGAGQAPQARPAWNAGSTGGGRAEGTPETGAIAPLPLSRPANPTSPGGRPMTIGTIPSSGPASRPVSPSYGTAAPARNSAPPSAGMQGSASTRSSSPAVRSAPSSVWQSRAGSSSGASSRGASGPPSGGFGGSAPRGSTGGFGGGGAGVGMGGGRAGGGGGGGGGGPRR